jgi:hypothetical protein
MPVETHFESSQYPQRLTTLRPRKGAPIRYNEPCRKTSTPLFALFSSSSFSCLFFLYYGFFFFSRKDKVILLYYGLSGFVLSLRASRGKERKLRKRWHDAVFETPKPKKNIGNSYGEIVDFAAHDLSFRVIQPRLFSLRRRCGVFPVEQTLKFGASGGPGTHQSAYMGPAGPRHRPCVVLKTALTSLRKFPQVAR